MKTVLVVDDNAVVRRHLVGLLQREMCNTVEAGDGSVALEMVSKHPVDVIFLDLSMPRMDGLTFMRQLRDQGCHVPVVLITASQSREEIAEAVRLGTQGYLLKPFTPPVVRTALAQSTGFDVAQIKYDPPNLALVDRDAALAHQIRELTPQSAAMLHINSVAKIPEMGSDWKAVFVGDVESNSQEEAEALAEAVWAQAQEAARIWIAPEGASLGPDTMFQALATRAQIPRAVKAIQNGMTARHEGRIRAFPVQEGPFKDLTWYTLEMSIVRTMRDASMERTEFVVDLKSTAKVLPEGWVDRIRLAADTLMVTVEFWLP